MQIVTDSGTDIGLLTGDAQELSIHVVPLSVALDGSTYREGIDITHAEFYGRLKESGSMPTTSQPSVGEFASIYRELASMDEEILSIHMSSGLSGTMQSALAAAQQVPEARITHYDTKTLSTPAGWQVLAAAKAARAGWPMDKILGLVRRIGDATDCLYTLRELSYLIHGGRISHMKGLIASVLRIKPIIGVEKVGGTYEQLGHARAFKGAIRGVVRTIERQHAPGSKLRVQVLHAFDPEGGAALKDLVGQRFDCQWLPFGSMSLVLGAHTGPSMVGVAFAAPSAFDEID